MLWQKREPRSIRRTATPKQKLVEQRATGVIEHDELAVEHWAGKISSTFSNPFNRLPLSRDQLSPNGPGKDFHFHCRQFDARFVDEARP